MEQIASCHTTFRTGYGMLNRDKDVNSMKFVVPRDSQSLKD